MSFGGFGGFGQNNNNTNNQQQQSSGFGFGNTNTQNTTANSGFGTSNTGAFGANTSSPSGGGLFGNTNSGFGNTSSGFGNTASSFGAPKSTFGGTTTTAGGLFGASNQATPSATGFGGSSAFGNTSANAPKPFGGTSLFGGGNNTSFGTNTNNTAATTSGTTLFGGGTTFGGSNSGFGATNNPGLGGNVGEPPGTGQVQQFNPFVEKETTNPSQSNAFQNILFLDPYKKWSAEELRLADYNQGRRHGNAAGTGAFGASTFGAGTGFAGNNASTSFGLNNTNNTNTSGTTGLFGTSQPAATGFGANTATSSFGGGGLFGNTPNKPATGLFGSTPASQPAQSTGLFGTSSAFGGNNNATGSTFGAANNSAGGGLFGNTQAQPKPSGFSFGGNTTNNAFGNTGGATGFGANTTATNTGGGLFGNTAAQQNNTGGGLFGNSQQQPATAGFGGATAFGQQPQNTGGGLFGNQPKPGGLFGAATTAANTGGGLFGNANANNASAPFGASATAQSTGGGLFGKPAATGSSLFGSTLNNPSTTAGTGLFGLGSTPQNQQPASNGLFGNTQNQQPKPGLFGAAASQPAGNGLFGAQNNQQGGGLFGLSANSQQQPQATGLNNSIFANSQNQSAQQGLSTNINDLNAYGSSNLFGNLGGNEAQNPGPLATPLSSQAKAKSRSILPMYKLSPANASRFVTPQKRGFGFSYSTYGTPTSPSSVASTPGGLGQSLLTGSIGRGLGKSISTSNLRRSFNADDSLLLPGAFSASSGPRFQNSVGSHKKLVINRDLRSDLFTSPTKDKPTPPSINGKLAKRVSFDTSIPAIESGAEPTEQQTPTASSNSPQELGYLRHSDKTPNGNSASGGKPASVNATPETTQVRGNELAVVHEEEQATPASQSSERGGDLVPGAYWMSPTKEEIASMNRHQRAKVLGFRVGRENVGSIEFKVPVDLTGIDLDDLFDNIITLEIRSATVYPNAAKKPPVGKGLNVPALISLEHSGPRAKDNKTPLNDKSGHRLNKHIERLKRIKDTTFEEFDGETGVWTFSVEHFTTYGLEEDDDDDAVEDGMDVEVSSLQVPRSAPTELVAASPDVDPDDTFEFRRYRVVPGAFEESALSDHDLSGVSDDGGDDRTPEHNSPAQPAYHQREDYDDEAQQTTQHDLMGGFDDYADNELAQGDEEEPAGVVRARMRALKRSTAPTNIQVAGGDDWAEILQQSVRAPRMADRSALRALNESGTGYLSREKDDAAPKTRVASDGAGFATSLDLMKSIFEQGKGSVRPSQAPQTRGFVKWPYQQQSKNTAEEESRMDATERAFRDASRVTFAADKVVIAAAQPQFRSMVETRLTVDRLQTQMAGTEISLINGVPEAKPASLLSDVHHLQDAEGTEKWAWFLASVLFNSASANRVALSDAWRELVSEETTRALSESNGTEEEKALICLSGHRITEACQRLVAAKNYRLATVVSLIGTSPQVKKDVREQLKDWRESNVLSELTDPIRAIWEIASGNTCACTGLKDVPLENRAKSFVISQQFGLSWRQAFGLRLWYGSVTDDDVAAAVKSFQQDIAQDREADPNDGLWGLLKLFADRSTKLEDVLDPANFGHAGDSRLSWQLGRALLQTGKVTFSADKQDAATLEYSSQLIAQGYWTEATFVLLHLVNPVARKKAVEDVLARHGAQLSRAGSAEATALIERLKIPLPWIFQALALTARYSGNRRSEVSFLLASGDFQEANITFLRTVAPDCIIKENYKDLQRLVDRLERFKASIPDWNSGINVYRLFLRAKLEGASAAAQAVWMMELVSGLASLKEAAKGLQEVAAAEIMAEDVARMGVLEAVKVLSAGRKRKFVDQLKLRA